MSLTKRTLELLFEIGAFRHVERTWKQFYDANVTNNAEHSFRVAWIALTLAKEEGVTNHEKVLKMALLHDLSESRCGDTNYLSRQYVAQNEEMSIKDIFKGTPHEQEVYELWKEYKERKSKEAQIVKDADTLDVDIEIQEQFYKGAKLSLVFKKYRKEVVYPRLYTKTAKRLWKEIANANPHDWHLRAENNRIFGGDWKK